MRENTNTFSTAIAPVEAIAAQFPEKEEGMKESHTSEKQTQKRVEEEVLARKDAIDMMCRIGAEIQCRMGATVRADSEEDFVVEYSGPKSSEQIVHEIQSIMRENRLRLIGNIRVIRALGRPMGLSSPSPVPLDSVPHVFP